MTLYFFNKCPGDELNDLLLHTNKVKHDWVLSRWYMHTFWAVYFLLL